MDKKFLREFRDSYDKWQDGKKEYTNQCRVMDSALQEINFTSGTKFILVDETLLIITVTKQENGKLGYTYTFVDHLDFYNK